MLTKGFKTGAGLVALCAVVLAVVPALGASESGPVLRPMTAAMRGGIGYFTPASADPKLAAIYARGELKNQGFRFTPITIGKSRDVTVAVRAPSGTANLAINRIAPPPLAPSASAGIEPVSYSLGASVGWQRFAVPGAEKARIDVGSLATNRDKINGTTGLTNRKWNTRVQIAAERPIGQVKGTQNGEENMSVDVGGSFRLTRNLDVTAGVRLRSDRDRLQQAVDQRRDSQAVYVGTAFKF
jgi:hypothetical protein